MQREKLMLLRQRMKELAQQFDLPEMVCLIDVAGEKTIVLQISLTDYANPFYNNFSEQVSMMVTECGKIEKS